MSMIMMMTTTTATMTMMMARNNENVCRHRFLSQLLLCHSRTCVCCCFACFICADELEKVQSFVLLYFALCLSQKHNALHADVVYLFTSGRQIERRIEKEKSYTR